MPEFATFDDLRRFAPTINEARVYLRKAASEVNKNVFLSHSSKDHEHLPGVIAVLDGHGGRVYIDDGDKRLPSNPSPKTADILRKTIKRLPRFVLFVTTNSKNSRWIPWELVF